MKYQLFSTRILCILTVLALLSCFFGCRPAPQTEEPPQSDETQASDILERVEIKPLYRDITYVSEEEKNTWREPLIRILSQMHPNGYWQTIDPDAEYPEDRVEYIPGGYGIALMDLTGDGVPEVLEAFSGGSSGNTFFEFYDLWSGENLGSFNTGWYGDLGCGDWSIRLDRESGDFIAVGQFMLRYGWQTRSRSIAVIRYFEEWEEYDAAILFSEVTNENFTVESYTDEEGNTWEEMVITDTDISYRYLGEDCDRDRYYDEKDRFLLRMQKIPGTELTLFRWEDAEDKTQAELAEDMADMLLSSTQRFVKIDFE